MTHQVLLDLYPVVDFNKEVEAVTWVSVLVGFSMVLRVSNLGPPARKDFSAHKHFTRNDYQLWRNVPSLCIRWSKTVQHKNKYKWVPIIPSPNKRICTQRWLEKMIKIIPASPHEPLFLIREGSDRFPLTSGQVNQLLKEWAERANIYSTTQQIHCTLLASRWAEVGSPS